MVNKCYPLPSLSFSLTSVQHILFEILDVLCINGKENRKKRDSTDCYGCTQQFHMKRLVFPLCCGQEGGVCYVKRVFTQVQKLFLH